MYLDVMLDLETLGTKPGSVILSIGAAALDLSTGELGPTFKRVVQPKACTDAGLKIDPDTVLWWVRQSVEARAAVTAADSVSLEHALRDFTAFLHGLDSPRNIKIWGNGATFDNALLAAAYDALGFSVPWRFSNDRCYRTLKNLHTDIPYPRSEVAHDCLIDAETQALHLLQIFAKYPVTE